MVQFVGLKTMKKRKDNVFQCAKPGIFRTEHDK